MDCEAHRKSGPYQASEWIMHFTQVGSRNLPARRRVLVGVALFTTCCWPSWLPGQSPDAEKSPIELQALTGTWIVTSAERDGQPFEPLIGVRYFIEPGLMRWADPKTRSEFTKLPVLMGRRIQHRSGNIFEATTIYPPASTSEVELWLEGNQLVITTDRTSESNGLALRLKLSSRKIPKPPLEKMVTLARQALSESRYDAAYQFAQLQLINFPEDADGMALLATASMRLSTQPQGAEPNRLERAREQATWAVEKLPDDHRLAREFAGFLYYSREFGPASEQFAKLDELGLLTPDDLVTYAQCEVLLSRVDHGKELLSTATGYDLASNTLGDNVPDKPNAGYLTLAIMLMKLGNPVDGERVLDAFVQQFPDSPVPYLHRGRFRLLNSNRDAAKDDFVKGVRSGSRRPRCAVG